MPLLRRVVIALLILSGVALLWWMRAAKTAATAAAATPAPANPAPAQNASAPVKAAGSADGDSGFDRITTADALGVAGGDIHRDLTILVTLLEDWRSFFPGDGNPWGSNAEITAMFMGKNRRKLVFIDPAHRAINADGELCDRWGTPFRFHALAGDRMEIRSAGPDKIFGNTDDALTSPP